MNQPPASKPIDTATKLTDSGAKQTDVAEKPTPPQIVRETIESLAVAFVLALLFKAFVAEAFVIPTGSMAPTLMGAHKDVKCAECGYQYQCGASNEYSEVGERTDENVFGTVCPLCRKPQTLDLVGNRNHQTFSGDRILVSKLAYTFGSPQRWHVFVFKHLEEARLNYIKRCIGRPNESVQIKGGDIYIHSHTSDEEAKTQQGERDPKDFVIARKPPHVVRAMLQPLADTDYPAKKLIEAGLPDAWQNESNEIPSAWTTGTEGNRWSASVDSVPEGKMAMLRYRHRVVDPLQWDAVETGGAFPKPVPADSYRLISDFTAYNASMVMATRGKELPANYNDIVQLEAKRSMRLGYTRPFSRPMENDGIHWTGDLSGEWEVTTAPGTQSLRLLLVEAGVEHVCDIDLATGRATARLLYGGNEIAAFEGQSGLTATIAAETPVRAGSTHRIQFANVDDALTLWINGTHVPWGDGGRFDVQTAVPDFQSVPRTGQSNPLDAAPLGFGIQGGSGKITHAKVYRDIYYIAHGSNDYLTDYNDVISYLKASGSTQVHDAYLGQMHGVGRKEYTNTSTPEALDRNALFSDANAWAASPMATQRRSVTFDLASDGYFPMGDNSSASQDARSWYEHHVPERLLIGRAVLVFWPHYWNAPIPFLPNFQRMGLIR